MVIIRIAGFSGSGKSTGGKKLAKSLAKRGLQTILISQDVYYDIKRSDVPVLRDFDTPNAFALNEWEADLARFAANEPVHIRDEYNYDGEPIQILDQCYDTSEVKVIIAEGLYSFYEPIKPFPPIMDDKNVQPSEHNNRSEVRIYINTPPDLCLCRRMRRDVKERNLPMESNLAQYEATVHRSLMFVAAQREKADFVINEVTSGVISRLAMMIANMVAEEETK